MVLPHRHIIALFLFFAGCVSFSQNYIHYTKKDGLAGNYVYRMTQDNEGFIWFLTETGMSKFDGKTFKNFTTKEGLPNNDIWHIRITPDNRVWYFTRSDRLGYIENDSVFSFKTSNNKMMNPNGGINQSGNKITILGNRNNYRFEDSIWQLIPRNKTKYKLLDHEIVFVGESKNLRLEDSDGDLLHSLKIASPHAKNQQLNDSLFVRLNLTACEMINLNTLESKYVDLSSLEPVPEGMGNERFQWANNQVQLSGNHWLISFDDNMEIKSTYSIPKHLHSTFNFIDRDGFIWLATKDNGVFKLPIGYKNSTSFLNDKKVTRIAEIEGIIYIGVKGEGVYKMIDNKPELWINDTSALWNIVHIDESVLYVFRNYILIEKNGVLKKIERNYPFFNYADQFVQFDGSIFTEGFSGVSKFSKNLTDSKYFYGHDNFEGLFVQNDSLFSFSYKQMLFYDPLKDVFLEYKDEQVRNKLLTSVSLDNVTYIGTEGAGLYFFKEGILKKLINDDHSVINNISVEDHHSIWTISEGSLLHYFKNESNHFSIKRYDQINGIPTNNLNALFYKEGQLYLGSTIGLTIINTDEIKDNISFTPYIKSVYVRGKKAHSDSLRFKYNKDLSIQVNFGSINFFDAENTTFQYLLSPSQINWTTTASGEVNLYDLQPDEYNLQLKVLHNDMEKIIEVPIRIKPKWWQTYWLVLFVTLIVAFLLFVFMYFTVRHYRNKLIQEKKFSKLQLSALRSQMNPHFVHNSLNAIQYYIQRNDVEFSENYLAKFSKLIRLFFEYSRRQHITIREETGLLDEYLQIEKLRFEDKLNYQIEIDKNIDVDERIIPSMILQPIVENAVNHGLFHKKEQGTVVLKFKHVDDSSFEVTIEDDGIGINKAKQIYNASSKNYQSRSSEVLKERLRLLQQSKNWNVSYSIEDRSLIDGTNGTRVTLTFNQTEET